MDKVKPTIDEVQIVITAPSRELANQIYQEAQQLARFSQPEIRVSNFVGGTDKQRQLNKSATSCGDWYTRAYFRYDE